MIVNKLKELCCGLQHGLKFTWYAIAYQKSRKGKTSFPPKQKPRGLFIKHFHSHLECFDKIQPAKNCQKRGLTELVTITVSYFVEVNFETLIYVGKFA